MAKISNATLKAECKRIVESADFVKKPEWTATESAIAAVRTILNEFGMTEELKPEYLKERQEAVAALECLFTAPINFRRTYLVDEGMMPKMEKGEKNAGEIKGYL